MTLYIATSSYNKNFSEKAITLKKRNPYIILTKFETRFTDLILVLASWDMIEHFYIWVHNFLSY